MPAAREDVVIDDDLDHGINLEQIAAFIRPELPGVTCYVEQTGGGCATIYLGDSYTVGPLDKIYGVLEKIFGVEHANAVRNWQRGGGPAVALFPREHPYGECRVVMAGPGWFAAPAWQQGRASPEEFTIGYDCNDPDPDVAADPFSELRWDLDLVYGHEVQYSGERVIARRMVQAYREHPRVKRGEVR